MAQNCHFDFFFEMFSKKQKNFKKILEFQKKNVCFFFLFLTTFQKSFFEKFNKNFFGKKKIQNFLFLISKHFLDFIEIFPKD